MVVPSWDNASSLISVICWPGGSKPFAWEYSEGVASSAITCSHMSFFKSDDGCKRSRLIAISRRSESKCNHGLGVAKTVVEELL